MPIRTELHLSLSLLLLICCNSKDIEPWTTNATGEYYLFLSRPDDITGTIRNLTCHSSNCIIQCNEEESCQQLNIHGSNATNIDLECNCLESKELRPGSCWKTHIFSENAQNLNVYCTTENCAGTTFYINHTHHSYFVFNGDWAGKYASIYGLNIKQNLSIICNDTQSCSDITIHCPFNTECNIICNGTKACFNGDIYVPNTIYISQYLQLDCNYSDDTSCDRLTIHCDGHSSNTLWFDTIDNTWKCFYQSECCPFEHKQNVITCGDGTECVIDCDESHCNWAVIDALNAHSLRLICNKADGCKLSTILCPEGDSRKCMVQCVGKRSCNYMNISSGLLSLLDVECASRSSCDNMVINVTVDGSININCSHDWSCANALFYIKGNGNGNGNGVMNGMDDGKMLSMECIGRYSCEGVAAYCPYGSKDSCLVKCSDHDGSCGGVQLFAPEQYQYGYLQIDCPIESTSRLRPCNFMKISCDGNEKSSVLRYLDNVWQCNNAQCCPWKQVHTNDKGTGIYGTVIAILCCLGTMYFLTTICNVSNNIQ